MFAPPAADAGISRPLRAGRSVSRHAALQCRCNRQRRAVGRPAGADLCRRDLRRAHGRRAAAAAGLPELVTTSLEDYEALALRLATEPGRLAALRHKLVRNRSTMPLFDIARFTREIEAAYARMWETWRAARPPAGFSISPMPDESDPSETAGATHRRPQFASTGKPADT